MNPLPTGRTVGPTAFGRPQLDPFDANNPELRTDPYTVYDRYRSLEPVHLGRRATRNQWYLFRYREVSAVLRDERLGRAVVPDSSLFPDAARPCINLMSDLVILRNPPDHTRLRSLLNKAFTPRITEELRPRIAAIANELLDNVHEQGTMDVIADFAIHLPLMVIAELLGVPPKDRRLLRDWSNDLILGFDVQPTMDDLARSSRAIVAFSAYMDDVIAEHRRRPADDLISNLLAVQEQEGVSRLSHSELIHNCIFLLVAGHETTTNLIANGTFALLQHRDQWERLLEDRSLIPNAVEELLRYYGPVQIAMRCAFEDFELGGQAIKRGDEVAVMLGAANRDPERWPEPQRLDVGREVGAHSSFAFGIHFCGGAALARAEGQIALETLLRRAPDLHLATSQVEWRDHFNLRGLKRLPVIF